MVSLSKILLLSFPTLCLLVAFGVVVLYLNQASEEAAENVTNTEGPSRNLLGDGVCDDDLNTELNGYDLGDCCEETSSRDLCQECRCPAQVIYKPHDNCESTGCGSGMAFHFVGNGKCNPDLNTMECFYDGGDCCLTGSERTCIKGIEFCQVSEIGDGYCQDYNKGPKCSYDGLDCCQTEDYYDETYCCGCIDAQDQSMGYLNVCESWTNSSFDYYNPPG